MVNLIWFGCGLFIAGALEAFLWKTPLFNIFNYPINVALFGENKKWRGLISLPITTLISTFLMIWLEKAIRLNEFDLITFSQLNPWQYGILTGFIFNFAELPNSFIKRKLNISPGDETNPLFFLLDHMDSTYGVLFLWLVYFKFPLHLIITGLVIAPALFIAATWLRKKWGLK